MSRGLSLAVIVANSEDNRTYGVDWEGKVWFWGVREWSEGEPGEVLSKKTTWVPAVVDFEWLVQLQPLTALTAGDGDIYALNAQGTPDGTYRK